MTTLDRFGVKSDPPKERIVLGRFDTWEAALKCARGQREKHPSKAVQIGPPQPPDGQRPVYIEV